MQPPTDKARRQRFRQPKEIGRRSSVRAWIFGGTEPTLKSSRKKFLVVWELLIPRFCDGITLAVSVGTFAHAGGLRGVMKTQDYRAMLRAVEQAIEVCDRQSGFMDEIHREICSGLRETRARLLRLIGPAPEPDLK